MCQEHASFWSQALSSDIDIKYKKSYSMIHLKRFIWKEKQSRFVGKDFTGGAPGLQGLLRNMASRFGHLR